MLVSVYSKEYGAMQYKKQNFCCNYFAVARYNKTALLALTH